MRQEALPPNKTKTVCTIGPASDSPEMIEKMIRAGMNIARLNFSHGGFTDHRNVIKLIRTASRKTGKRVSIMADLPGPKMRIGNLSNDLVYLEIGSSFVLTTADVDGTCDEVSVSFESLPRVVAPGTIIFLNDGQIQLEVDTISGERIICKVLVGGKLRSRKGINLPGVDLGISAFTEHDQDCMRFALENGVDAISQSFVNNAGDIHDVRNAAKEMGYRPFIIAKIERSSVLENLDEILQATDGVMVARGDLGVEIPIEEIAVTQKNITAIANLYGKPVITATQMLESMTSNRRPTRAEATDVANAILDGTDCVMLSEESAMGAYPLEAVEMLVKIARAVEPHRAQHRPVNSPDNPILTNICEVDYIASSICSILKQKDNVAAILSPTDSGLTARRLSRFKLTPWILAVSASQKTCSELMFSYGVYPIFECHHPIDWTGYARDYAVQFGLLGHCIIQTEGPSPENPNRNHKMEIIDLREIREI